MMSRSRILAIFPFLFVFYEITIYLSNDMYLPALPAISTELETTRHYAQMTLTTWFLGTASLQLILGPLSDRIGRKPVVVAGIVVFILSSFVCAITSNITTLLVARFFQGAVVSTISVGYSAIHELYDQHKSIVILAIIGSIVVIAPSCGPLIGALVLQFSNWRWIFGILTISGIIALLILWLWMPETNPKSKRQLLLWKQIIKNYGSILTTPLFMLNVLISCLTFLGLITWIAAGPFIIIKEFHYSTILFGLFQIMVFGTWIIGSQLIKYIMRRFGLNKLVNSGLIILVVGSVLGMILTAALPNFIWGLIITFMIFSFGSSLIFSASQRLAIESCQEPMGARLAILSLILCLFGVFGTLLASLTYQGTLIWIASLLFLVALLACLMRWIVEKLNSRA